jgi:hypothetical protein
MHPTAYRVFTLCSVCAQDFTQVVYKAGAETQKFFIKKFDFSEKSNF